MSFAYSNIVHKQMFAIRKLSLCIWCPLWILFFFWTCPKVHGFAQCHGLIRAAQISVYSRIIYSTVSLFAPGFS